MKRINKILLALALLLAAQNAWAAATTKTVTYTLSRVEVENTSYWALTHSGDTPFDGRTSVQSQLEDGHTSATFALPDGFTFTFNWKGGTVTSSGSNFVCQNQTVQFKLQWDIPHRYVTSVSVTTADGTNAKLDGGGDATTNFGYSEQSTVSFTLATYKEFSKLVITYANAPDLSVFENDGTNAYKIRNKADLRHLADYVNNGGNNCKGFTFRQTQPITCDATYTPIGYYISQTDKVGFAGTYDGQGKTISGITVSRTGNTDADGYIGLIGYVDIYGATIKNVILSNSTFTGANYAGGIVGHLNTGTVENCRVESDVIINAGVDGAEYHGGIAGYLYSSYAEIIGCVSAAKVSSNNKNNCSKFGGIVGYKAAAACICNCLFTGTTITADSDKGAIVGSTGSNSNLINNYYTAIDLGGVNGNDQNGARRAWTVTLNEGVVLVGDETIYNYSGITAIGTTALKSGSTIYSGATQTLTLNYTGTVPAGYSMAYSATAGTIRGNTLSMPAGDVTVIAFVDHWNIAGGATGDETHPYIISTTEGFNQLADNVSAGVSYSGKFFKLNNNITVNHNIEEYHKVGTSAHKFSGTFDGDGNTLTFYYHSFIYEDAAPFAYVDGATFLNLHVAGTITTAKKYAAGIVAHSYGTTNITNCRSSVTIDSIRDGDGTHGGFVAVNEPYASLTIAGCLFDGKLLTHEQATTKKCGGFVGYTYGTESCSITNSLYDPAGYKSGEMEINDAESATFICNGSAGANCYYTRKLGSAQGKQAHTVTLGDNIVLSGTLTQYNVSGLTAISATALSTSDGTIYSGEGQTLTLATTAGFTATYCVNGNPIEGNSFTMPATGNVTVSATLTPAATITITGHLHDGFYWTTFYHGSFRYTLPEGAQAYTMGTDHKLYRLGDDGRVIPKNTAVVIISDCADIELTSSDSASEVAIHGPDSKNILHGGPVTVTDGEVPVPGSDPATTGTPYVLGVAGNPATIGFYQFTGNAIPANKTYYVE